MSSLGAVLLAVLAVLWLATLLAGAAIYGVRVRPRGQELDAWPRWVGVCAVLSAVLLAIVLPALTVFYSAGEREHVSNTGARLTDQEVEGRDLFTSACKRCHTLADAGASSTIGPNLDALEPSYDTVVDAVLSGRARGRGQMPAGLSGPQGARAVARYLEEVAGRRRSP